MKKLIIPAILASIATTVIANASPVTQNEMEMVTMTSDNVIVDMENATEVVVIGESQDYVMIEDEPVTATQNANIEIVKITTPDSVYDIIETEIDVKDNIIAKTITGKILIDSANEKLVVYADSNVLVYDIVDCVIE